MTKKTSKKSKTTVLFDIDNALQLFAYERDTLNAFFYASQNQSEKMIISDLYCSVKHMLAMKHLKSRSEIESCTYLDLNVVTYAHVINAIEDHIRFIDALLLLQASALSADVHLLARYCNSVLREYTRYLNTFATH